MIPLEAYLLFRQADFTISAIPSPELSSIDAINENVE